MICSGCEDGLHGDCSDGQMNAAQTGPILCDCASKNHDTNSCGCGDGHGHGDRYPECKCCFDECEEFRKRWEGDKMVYKVQRNNGWNLNIKWAWVVVGPDGLAVGGSDLASVAMEQAALLNERLDHYAKND